MAIRALRRFTRNAEAPVLLEGFFIAAVASFLGIRWFLGVTGYPRIGSGGIHIAHMLWGGLLMLVALMLLLAFLDRSVRELAAVVAGLGFGTFIDEIGKFVTSDNNYFYRPAVALIYGLFVIAFLVARTLVGQTRLTADEARANAVHLLAGTREGPIEPGDRARIQRLLDLADPNASLTRLAKGYLAELPGTAEQESPVETVYRRIADAYEAVMANQWAERAIVVGVVAYAVLEVVGAALIGTSGAGPGGQDTASVATIGQVGSTVAGAALVGVGVVSLPRSRVAAYHWFLRGLLVWILIAQVFVFYSSQLAGLGGLAVDLVAYASLRFAITRELAAGRGLRGAGPRADDRGDAPLPPENRR